MLISCFVGMNRSSSWKLKMSCMISQLLLSICSILSLYDVIYYLACLFHLARSVCVNSVCVNSAHAREFIYHYLISPSPWSTWLLLDYLLCVSKRFWRRRDQTLDLMDCGVSFHSIMAKYSLLYSFNHRAWYPVSVRRYLAAGLREGFLRRCFGCA